MCKTPTKNKSGRRRGKKREESPTRGFLAADYSHIFTESYVHRAVKMHRLLQDPFYIAMNVSAVNRMWMLRHLVPVVCLAERNFKRNLKQFFELAGRDAMEEFMKYKNAPQDMYTAWDRLFPVTSGPASIEKSKNTSNYKEQKNISILNQAEGLRPVPHLPLG